MVTSLSLLHLNAQTEIVWEEVWDVQAIPDEVHLPASPAHQDEDADVHTDITRVISYDEAEGYQRDSLPLFSATAPHHLSSRRARLYSQWYRQVGARYNRRYVTEHGWTRDLSAVDGDHSDGWSSEVFRGYSAQELSGLLRRWSTARQLPKCSDRLVALRRASQRALSEEQDAVQEQLSSAHRWLNTQQVRTEEYRRFVYSRHQTRRAERARRSSPHYTPVPPTAPLAPPQA